MASKTRRGTVEWVGGSMVMPTADDASETFETFFWLNARGDLLGTTTYVTSRMAESLAESFRETTASPGVGEPHVPARIRVESEEHASALRRAVGPGTEVVCAPTPETEPVRISLAAYLDKIGSAAEETYLTSGIEPEAIARFFRAVARLYVAAPWRQINEDQTSASVTITTLGVRRASLTVLGNDGSPPGLLLFHDERSAMEYRIMLDEADDEDEPVPPHIALALERGADVEASLRKEIAKHGWTVAGPAAYPAISVFDEDGLPRPPSARELATMEAVAQALVILAETKPEALRAMADGDAFDTTTEVETSRGVVTVELRALTDEEREAASYADLDEPDEAGAEEARAAAAEILRRFRKSPEGARLKQHHDWPGLLLEHARAFFGASVQELTSSVVEDIVFASFPQKVSCPPEVAGSIVEELRAFFAFLEREQLCPEAAACARLLGKDAEKKLRDGLSDPRSFGMAKTMIMAGLEAGYDLSTEEGMAAWLGEANDMFAGEDAAPPRLRSVPTGAQVKSSSSSSSSHKKDKAKRNKSKAARASRKNNR